MSDRVDQTLQGKDPWLTSEGGENPMILMDDLGGKTTPYFWGWHPCIFKVIVKRF